MSQIARRSSGESARFVVDSDSTVNHMTASAAAAFVPSGGSVHLGIGKPSLSVRLAGMSLESIPSPGSLKQVWASPTK